MPTWAISGASRSRPPGSASCCRRSPSTISARARCCSTHPEKLENPFFLLYPGLGAAADGGARDGGDHHREPGGHHRRLFADPAGDPARPPAAHGDPPHLGDREGPDLHPARELASARRGRLSRDRVPLVERARLGLRHRRHRHDGDHDRDGLPRAVEMLALVGRRRRRS